MNICNTDGRDEIIAGGNGGILNIACLQLKILFFKFELQLCGRHDTIGYVWLSMDALTGLLFPHEIRDFGAYSFKIAERSLKNATRRT